MLQQNDLLQSFVRLKIAVKFRRVGFLIKLRLRATWCTCRMGSQCYLPPNKWTHPALTPAIQAGTRFTYPRWMEGWVDLGDWLTGQCMTGSQTRKLLITSPAS